MYAHEESLIYNSFMYYLHTRTVGMGGQRNSKRPVAHSESGRLDYLPMPVTPPLFGKDGIIVTYQQYEIAAYAAGMPSFVIPYNKAKGLLNQTGKALL